MCLEHFLLDCPALSNTRSLYEGRIVKLVDLTRTRKERVTVNIGNINDVKICSRIKSSICKSKVLGQSG